MHPLAWWVWAAAVAVAITLTSSTFAVLVLLGAVVAVALCRRDDAPWARSLPVAIALGALIVLARVLFHVLVGIKTPGTVVLDLPRVPMPDWAVGVELLGPVTSAGLATAASDGLRLAAVVVCVGAAGALANPKRALRCLPASMHHLGTAVVIAVTVTPQLVSAAGRVRRAQRLRGGASRGLRALSTTTVPVLAGALDRSLSLAASMDSRGFARTDGPGTDRRVAVLLLAALVAALLGTYGLLTGGSPVRQATILVLGLAAAAAASRLAGRRVRRTRYRPDRWGPAATSVAVAGLSAPVVILLAGASSNPAVPGLAGVAAAAPVLMTGVVR